MLEKLAAEALLLSQEIQSSSSYSNSDAISSPRTLSLNSGNSTPWTTPRNENSNRLELYNSYNNSPRSNYNSPRLNYNPTTGVFENFLSNITP